MIIDVHVHAFPDSIAPRAMAALAEEADIRPALDGTLSALLDSMDRSGIERAVLASIATQPAQFKSILRWSEAVASPRILPFPSVHPESPHALAELEEVAARGLRGIKWHPYYQDFNLDEPRLWPLYAAMERLGLILLLHAGYDIAFPLTLRRANPARLARVLDAFPNLRVIAAHFGGWKDWDEVETHLLGRKVYLDTSFSLSTLGRQRARAMIERHPPDLLLFGSDSPWADQREALREIEELDLPSPLREELLGVNAARLLDPAFLEDPA